jgi:hypothetical protein
MAWVLSSTRVDDSTKVGGLRTKDKVRVLKDIRMETVTTVSSVTDAPQVKVFTLGLTEKSTTVSG